MSLLGGGLSHSDTPQVAIISVYNSVPCDGAGVNVKPREPRNLLFSQSSRIPLEGIKSNVGIS